MNARFILISILFICGLAFTVLPQTPPSGTLRGAIVAKGPDAQPYNISGANLRLKGVAQLMEATSDDEGEYEFVNLWAGEYTLEVSAQGFKTVSKVVVVHADETLIENITLELAEIQESVTVKSSGDGLQTTEAAPGSRVEQKKLQTLPLTNERLWIRCRLSQVSYVDPMDR